MSSLEHAFCRQEQPMIFLPVYEATTSPSPRPLDANPTTDRLPTAFLPSYSIANPSRWWEEAAVEVLRTSHDFALVTRTIRFIPLPDPTIAATLLSKRSRGWLGAFLKLLCRDEDIEEPHCDSLLSTAEAIVAIIRRRPSSHAPRWKGAWLFSDLFSSDIPAVAEKLDSQIHSEFCRPTFSDWTAWRCGYQCEIISQFLEALLNLRNDLVQLAQQNRIVLDQLLLLQEELPSQQPLLRWMVSTAISFDTSSGPSEVLRFFLDPIAQQFEERCTSITSVGQKLSILDARFRSKIVHEVDPKWPRPFSVDFTLWENIQNNTSQELAESNTESVSRLFMEVSIADVLSDGGYLKDIGRLWSELADDALACLSADKELTSYFMRLAEYSIVLRNVHSATAIGLALFKWGFRPHKPSRVWNIINPNDNFAGCRNYMAEEPFCLPLIFPYIVELRRSGDAPDKMLEIFHLLVRYFGGRQEAKAGKDAEVGEKEIGEGTIDYRNSPGQTEHFSSSWTLKQLTRNVAQDLDVGPSQSSAQTESFARFQNLPLEIRHSIWKQSLPEPRIFDIDTLQLLKPQHGVICLDLIPSILQVCKDSRASAQSCLYRTVLFRSWTSNRGRMLYFDPKRDIYKYHFTDLLWRRSCAPGQCLFGCVEIIANISREQLTDTFGYGLRSVEFHNKFPNLKRLIVTNRHTNILGDVLRNGWSEAQWNREFRLNGRKWEREWKSVREFFEERDILITSSSINPDLASQQVTSSAVVCHKQNSSTPDPGVIPGHDFPKNEYHFEYRRANGDYTQRVRRFSSSEQSLADSEATDILPEEEIRAMMDRNFPGMDGTNAAKTQDQAHLALQEAVESFYSRDQDHRVWEEREKLSLNRDTFECDKHLIFSPPKCTWSLADMELEVDNATSSFAVSGDFPLFSAAAVGKMREELLTDEIQHTFQMSSSTSRRQVRGMAPEHAKFTYNAWNHPKTLAAISQVAGTDLVPVMDIEISHLEILGSNSDKHPVGWHRDDYPYACALVLCDTTDITQGHTLLRTGSGGILVCDCPKMGFAYVLQGHCIEHAVQAFKGCSELIIAITSFRPRSPFLQDQTQLRNVHTASDLSQLRSQFFRYRMAIAIKRLTALKQTLNGERVIGYAWKSSLLGENFEQIRRFLQETCEQLGMAGNNAPMPIKSTSNAIDLTTNSAAKKLGSYSFGLHQAAKRLALGVQQQRDKTKFEARLAQSTFERVDYILRVTREGVGAALGLE